MDALLIYLFLGLGVGSLYALAGLGVVVIYRGSGVLNFAHGSLAMISAYMFYELHVVRNVSYAFAFMVSLAMAVAVGLAFQMLVLRFLENSANLMRVIATVALFMGVQGIAIVRYGDQAIAIPSALPNRNIELGAGVAASLDRIVLLLIVVAFAVVLHWAYRSTSFGRSATAVAENQVAAASVGVSPARVNAGSWALGSLLAGVAGILIVPITGLSVRTLTDLTLIAMAAAMIGGFTSFRWALVGGLAIGVVQTELVRFSAFSSASSAIPLLFIVVFLSLRGKIIPQRDQHVERQPMVGDGRVRWLPLLLVMVAFYFVDFAVGLSWADAFISTFSVAIVLLSILVLTGYAGQLSLGQWALAGCGAFAAAHLTERLGMPFVLALVVGAAAAAVVGLAFAVPAIRTRGVSLAIVTFGLGGALEEIVFNNADWTGGLNGVAVGQPSVAGVNVGAVIYPERYAFVTFVLFVILAVAVAWLRRSGLGRSMLAVRSNERAAAALGIGVPGTKLAAFAVAAAIAGVGGVVAAYRDESIIFQSFDNSLSLVLVGFAVIGGIGWLTGPVLGATLATGAVGSEIIAQLWPQAQSYVQAAAGIVLLLVIASHPDGMAEANARLLRRLIVATQRMTAPLRGAFARGKTSRGADASAAPAARSSADLVPREAIPPCPSKTLYVDHVTVRYGSTVAASDVSMEVGPGKVVGLIGPNGAGKTSVIDAISGFTPGTGSVRIEDQDLTGRSASKRARMGLSRSFQGLELFEDLTVRDNLLAAMRGSAGRPVRWGRRGDPLSPRVMAVLSELGLLDDLDRRINDLPYGARRLLSIARAICSGPSVILLDEPAAGLSAGETQELAAFVRRLAGVHGMGVLLVEHDVNFVMSTCAHVVVLDFGKVIAEGKPAEVSRNPRVVEAYLGTSAQTGVSDDDTVVVR